MSRRYVNQLGHQEPVDQVFLVSEKQLRPNRNGNLYLQMELSDRTGKINPRMWNASEVIYRAFDNGDYIHVEGTTQLFQGAVQLIATRLERASPKEVDPDDFAPLRAVRGRQAGGPRGRDPPQPHRALPVDLAECFLMDEDFISLLARCRPASRTITPISAACNTSSRSSMARPASARVSSVDRDLL